MTTYRVGNHQPQNVYRGDQYIGVMFTAEDAALVVEALNGQAPALCLTWIGGMARMCELPHGHDGNHEPKPIGYCPNCVERHEGQHGPCFDEVVGCTEEPPDWGPSCPVVEGPCPGDDRGTICSKPCREAKP